MDECIIEIKDLKKIPVDSIVRAFKRQETLRHHPQNNSKDLEGDPIFDNDSKDLSNITQTLINVCAANDLDTLVTNIAQEIIGETLTKSDKVQRGSTLCLYIYRIFLFLSYSIIATAGFLGINGLNDLSKGTDIEKTMVFVTGIMSAIGLTLSGINEFFDFGKRSRKLNKYHKKFEQQILKTRHLLVTGDQPLTALSKLTDIEMEIDQIDTKVFPLDLSTWYRPLKTRPTFNPVVGRRMCQINPPNFLSISDSEDSD